MRANLRIETMKSAAEIVKSRMTNADVASLGLSMDDYKLVTGNKPWLGSDRQRVSRAIQSLSYGVLDILGIPRYDVPAEYVGAVLAIFVHPANLQLSCVYADRVKTVDDMLCPDAEGDVVSPSSLFALVLQYLEDPTSSNAAKEAFNKRVGLREQSVETPVPNRR